MIGRRSADCWSRASGIFGRSIHARFSIPGSRATARILIENGKITRPVKNLRFNESPIFMLNNLEAMGVPERVSASEGGEPGPGDHGSTDQGARFQFHQLE